MSEVLGSPSLSIDEYQAQVLETRRDNYDPAGWEELYSGLIRSEFFELQGQHGPTMLLLKRNSETKTAILEEHPEAVDGAKKEIGDLLWFGVSAADHLGTSAKKLCVEALQARTGRRDIAVESFADLQEEVAASAFKIRVLNKWGLRHPEASDEVRYTNLFESPDYLLSRTVFRLSRILVKGRDDVAPYTASMMEPLLSPGFAIGDYLNALTYAARRMNLDIEEIARANIDKLRRRQAYGKDTG